jgi:redox-sensitive bicupin YhaK (pirin superfamily)
MIEIRSFDGLGRFANEWLEARYHFSFADYHDPARMGVGTLRVWNDDLIHPGTGFPPHPHRDMEIVTYVREGAITHEDHLGNRGRTGAGCVQVMSAGKGIVHAEYNRESVPARIFQIWIQTDAPGHTPRWETRDFPAASPGSHLVPLASGRPAALAAGALRIHQDATVFGATLEAGQSVTHTLEPGRHAYLVAARGRVRVNGQAAGPRDGVAVSDEDRLTVEADEAAEIVLVDVP